MDKYLLRSSSVTSLGSIGSNKRPREEDALDDWKLPKRPSKASETNPKPPIRTSNRFGCLSDNMGEHASTQSLDSVGKKPPRIPAIIVELDSTLSHKILQETVMKYSPNFHLQYKSRNKVAIHVYTGTCHQRVKEGLLKENVLYHTFTRRDEKLPKAVIRGLPLLSIDEIADDLGTLGYKDCKVVLLKTRAASVPSNNPLYLIQLPVGTNMSKFRQIRFVCKCVIEINKFKPKNWEGTQCFRCQRFGHASSNCNLSPRCVKCLEPHSTKECPKKDRTTPAQCCNCKEAHPANFRQCPARKTYLERTRSQRKPDLRSTQPMQNVQTNKIYSTMNWAATGSNPRPALSPAPKRQTDVINDDPVFKTVNQGKQDSCTREMLHILNIIKSLKKEFLNCDSMVDKVILILNHLSQYV